MRSTRRSTILFACVLLAMGHATSVRAADPAVSKRASLILRVLAYDRNFKARTGTKKPSLLVIQPDAPDSPDVCAELAGALEQLTKRISVDGMQLSVSRARSSDKSLKSSLAAATAAYVCRGVGGVRAIVTVARQNRVLTLGGADSEVNEGLSVGLIERAGKTSVVLNLASAKAEGADLAALSNAR